MQKLKRELAGELAAERFDVTDEGIYFPRQSVLASGEYFGRVNGGAWEKEGDNLVPNEGITFILNVALGNVAKPAGFYIALFNGGAVPAANWSAASFVGVASEIVSMGEGYTNATRPQWTPSVATGTTIDNFDPGVIAKVTIATASSLTVTGAALLTSSTRGGSSGALISATKYAAERTFQNGDNYDIGYRLALTV